jgi:hypothetical protein
VANAAERGKAEEHAENHAPADAAPADAVRADADADADAEEI